MRRTFLDFLLFGWRIRAAYGSPIRPWAQWNTGDGGAVDIGPLLLSWRKCVCFASTPTMQWAYCSFHGKKIS